MRALVLYGPEDLRELELAIPEPGAGEVVVAIEAALTCATDAKTWRRGAHPSLGPLPARFGHEGAGVIAAVGEGVVGFSVADPIVMANSAPCEVCEWCLRGRWGVCPNLVYLNGTYAEYVCVPAAIVAANLIIRPHDLPAHVAALTEPVACGVRAVERSVAAAGDVVIILGGGLQGQVACGEFARRGCEVILCDPHRERRALARAMGASQVADAPRTAAECADLRAMTPGGLGAHVTVAAVGDARVWETAAGVVRPGGEVNFHGGPAPHDTVRLDATRLHYQEITLQASYHHTPHSVRTALDRITENPELFGRLLGDEIPLNQVAHALRAGGVKRIVRPTHTRTN
jgi:L-iditol 2-dehydrogenase